MQHDNNKNGFLYIWIKGVFHILYKFNIVEPFKTLAWWVARGRLFKVPRTVVNEKRIKNIAIDIYKLLKLVITLILWIFRVSTIATVIITVYLIVTTLLTYLKYHFWARNSNNDYERNRRRFISMILSFAFIIIAYGYLYDVPFKYTIARDNSNLIQSTINNNNISVSNGDIEWDEALLYSISNAFGGNYSSIIAVNKVGDWLSISQIVITFIYITLIFAKSLSAEGGNENAV